MHIVDLCCEYRTNSWVRCTKAAFELEIVLRTTWCEAKC